MICVSASASGCGLLTPKKIRTIYVPAGTPVRLRETIRNAKVWVKDASGVDSESEMDLPEGWYCLEDTGK